MSGSKLSNPAAPQENTDQPLGLTIHSLPQPVEAGEQDAHRTRLGRWKMIFVLLICAAPVLASYFTYYVLRPESRSVYGELIEPQREWPAIQAVDLQGRAIDLQSLKGQWLLVTVGSGTCPVNCERNLYFQRQLREVLGKDKDRLDRVWLINDQAAVSPALLPALQQAQVLRLPAQVLAQWLPLSPAHAPEDHLYVVDPMGHLMMRFPAHMDVASAAKAKRDLERLMRASASWDTAGR